MKKLAVAFDTSNYTTSCASFDGAEGHNSGRLLDVAPGQLGLRQSEELFSHVKRLPSIFAELSHDGEVVAVGTPEEICLCERSYTGKYLKKVMENGVRE